MPHATPDESPLRARISGWLFRRPRPQHERWSKTGRPGRGRRSSTLRSKPEEWSQGFWHMMPPVCTQSYWVPAALG